MPPHLHTALITLCRFAVGFSFAVLIFAVLVQVLGRSVFSSSPVWTEELTRFALLYLAAFGAGLSYRSGDLVNVDIVSEALPGRLPVLLRFVSAAATIVLCAALILPAWRFTVIGNLQTSPALGWRMSFIHASVLVLIGSLFLFALLRAVAMLAGRSDGRPAVDPDLPQ
ncbi:TRAP transporter small permease [Chelativorans salis]|uniref:TRAP transporter small permease protein n=1 Tax=Chelativorans salis TaxID=2978478 RepID=A0ABT2LV38_9HYPH|nr:TRAP transporter small permease [Chelativorans sp. EGI FJ00035]MCT7378398.1 TRAP transporter small permease [Chelativorans sp. EGI FJ00035]